MAFVAASRRASGTCSISGECALSNWNSPTSAPYFFWSFWNFGSRDFHMLYSGMATANDEYEPASRPMDMANAKSFNVSPPNSSMANTGTNEVSVVLMVRTNT